MLSVDLLVCPIHRTRLIAGTHHLSCVSGCAYPIVAGIPFLLPRNVSHTHPSIAASSFALAEAILSGNCAWPEGDLSDGVDAVVQRYVAGTNSTLYKPLVGRLSEYPIPPFPISPARHGSVLLDVGCGWGRWCIAAARAGFTPVGIDPSLESVLAAERVSRRLGIAAVFIVGDSRYLPFARDTFDAAFSYSVLQHFSKEDVRATLRSLATVLKNGATSKLHMLNRYGLRSLQVQLARGLREAAAFETRYWSPRELREAFSSALGPSHIEIDGFFVQGRYEDRHLFKLHHRSLVEVSHLLTRAADLLPFLATFADNLFVVSQVHANAGTAAGDVAFSNGTRSKRLPRRNLLLA